ncbi:PAS domain S-box protein [Rhizobium sp. PL01]|uniref:sensor histidine kinase n=1 Tax=Rhizobium sp. PL01 TaxID=3085631 RepID=UPI002980D1EF|nr:PAS domain S-box protein [Rhizobium sp. PL01]MDW5317489.1 PAS domain S-box protein [Rhizobium sp. PL01]
MSESDLLRPERDRLTSCTSKWDKGNFSNPGVDDEVAHKPKAYLEPTPVVSSALFEHVPIAVLMVDQAGKIRHMNNATVKLFGYLKDELVGEPIEILVPSGARTRHETFRKDFMTHPTARPMAEGRRLTARKKDGTEVSVDIALNPISLGESETAVILSVLDAAPRERAEIAELFVKEVTHRARNMFAIIGAISRQISKYTTTVPEFQAALERRLHSLSTSYQVFEKENWRAAPISDLVRSQISFVVKQDIPQIDIAGPDIRLQAAPAEYLGLAIHELATNAVKHGALSVPTGEISIHWSVDEKEGVFKFHWSERNGPPFTPSERRGFGSVMLNSIVPAACGGTADLIVSPAGMSWSMNAPLGMLARSD